MQSSGTKGHSQQGKFAKFALRTLSKTRSAPNFAKQNSEDIIKAQQQPHNGLSTAHSIARIEAELRAENERLERSLAGDRDNEKEKNKNKKSKKKKKKHKHNSTTKKERESHSGRASRVVEANDNGAGAGGGGGEEEGEDDEGNPVIEQGLENGSGAAPAASSSSDKDLKRRQRRSISELGSAAAANLISSVSSFVAGRKARKDDSTTTATFATKSHSNAKDDGDGEATIEVSKNRDEEDEGEGEGEEHHEGTRSRLGGSGGSTRGRRKRASTSSSSAPLSAIGVTPPHPSSYSLSPLQAAKLLSEHKQFSSQNFSISGAGHLNNIRHPPAATNRNGDHGQAPYQPTTAVADGLPTSVDQMKKQAMQELQAYQNSQGDDRVLQRAIRNKYLLHVSVEAGQEEVVRFLVNNKKLKLNTTDAMGWTPLHCACTTGNPKIILFLLSKKRTNVQKVTSDGCTALHYLIRHFPEPFTPNFNGLLETYSDITKRLVATGCDINATNRNGETVLHCAAFRGKSTAVRFLLAQRDWDIDVNATTNAGETALHLACYSGSLEVLDALLEGGAATNIVGINGTPLDIAKRQNERRLVIALLKHQQKKEPSRYCMDKEDAQYLGYTYSSTGEDGDLEETTTDWISDVDGVPFPTSALGSSSSHTRQRGENLKKKNKNKKGPSSTRRRRATLSAASPLLSQTSALDEDLPRQNQPTREGKGKEVATDEEAEERSNTGLNNHRDHFDKKPRWEEEQQQQQQNEDRQLQEQQEEEEEGVCGSGPSDAEDDSATRGKGKTGAGSKGEVEEKQHKREIKVLIPSASVSTHYHHDEQSKASEGSSKKKSDDGEAKHSRSPVGGSMLRRSASFDDKPSRRKRDKLSKKSFSVGSDSESDPHKRLSSSQGNKSTKQKEKKKKENEAGHLKKAKEKRSSSSKRKRKKREKEKEEAKESRAERERLKKMDDEQKIKVWLSELNLPAEYLALFQQDGFDDMSTIQLITEEDLAEIGIAKTGHRKRIMRWVNQNPPSPIYSPQPTPRNKVIVDESGSPALVTTTQSYRAKPPALGQRSPSFSPSRPLPHALAFADSSVLNSPHSISLDHHPGEQHSFFFASTAAATSQHRRGAATSRQPSFSTTLSSPMLRASKATPPKQHDKAKEDGGDAALLGGAWLGTRSGEVASSMSSSSLPRHQLKDEWWTSENSTSTQLLSPRLLKKVEDARQREKEERERRLYGNQTSVGSPLKVLITSKSSVAKGLPPTSSPISPRHHHQITSIPIPTTHHFLGPGPTPQTVASIASPRQVSFAPAQKPSSSHPLKRSSAGSPRT